MSGTGQGLRDSAECRQSMRVEIRKTCPGNPALLLTSSFLLGQTDFSGTQFPHKRAHKPGLVIPAQPEN